MTGTARFEKGNYSYIPAVFQYSGGAAADPGFTIERVTFRKSLPLAEGFAAVEALIRGVGRPITAFCACELRSPGQFSEAGFIAFNQHYCETLARWGLYDEAAGVNPVARSNVCPDIGGPPAPGFHAFSYTVPASEPAPSFVISGSGEAPEGKGAYGKYIVRRGETGADAMREKARAVLGEMERRMGLFGRSWRDTTATQIYTVHDIHPFLGDEIVRRGAAPSGVIWHLARPPVVELEYEMDCRAVAIERVV